MKTIHNFKVGDKVVANGFPGTVSRVCEWSDAMIEVRLASGTVCVDGSDPITVQRIA